MLLVLALIVSFLSLGGICTLGYFYYIDRTKREVFWKNQSVSHGQLEEMYGALYDGLNQLGKKEKETESFASKSRSMLGYTVVKLGMHRYNSAADDVGGNLSFSVAFLDEHDSGVVLSSLHGRGSSRVYCKPIESGRSSIMLTDEEVAAIKTAQQSWQAKLFVMHSTKTTNN